MKELERSSQLTDDQKKLIEENLEFAHKVALKSDFARSLNSDDVIDIATEALVKAAMHFDQKKGVKFTSFAYRVIMNFLADKVKKDHNYKDILVAEFKEEYLQALQQDYTDVCYHEQKQRLYDFLIKHQHDREINLLIHRHFNNEDKVITQFELSEFFDLSQSQLSHLEKIAKERIQQELVHF